MNISTQLLSRLMLLSSLIALLFSSAVGKEGADLFQLPQGWYKARFQMAIKTGSGGLIIHLHQHKKDIVGEKLAEKFQLVSPALNKVISADDTVNPFKESFPHLYTQPHIKKRLSCPMYGIRLEVDDDPKSKEWLLIFSAKKCFDSALYGTDAAPHQWLLQQDKAGKYRILMEAESEFSSLVKANGERSYKLIHNELDIARSLPESDLKCGKAQFIWQYSGDLKGSAGRYELLKTSYGTHQCQSKYPSPGLPDWEFKKLYLAKVKKVVDVWKQRASASHTLHVKERALDVKQQALMKKPVLLHPRFNMEELRVIEKLLSKKPR